MDRKAILVLVACFALMLLWPALVDRLRERFEVTSEEVTVAVEDVIFRAPPMRAVA